MVKKRDPNQIPEPALRRLPWYLAYTKLLKAQGVEVASSTFIAKSIGLDPALVAKDLSYINVSGKTRVGYNVENIIAVLDDFLGFTELHRAYIFGVGNLGAALISDKGLGQYGLEIVGGFDTDTALCGTRIKEVEIYHMDELESVMDPEVTIGILTVPVDHAQEVTDRITQAGIRAVWNFTPYRITVPDGVVVQNTSLYAHLAVMFNRMDELDRAEKQ